RKDTHMTDEQLDPPRWAQALLRVLLRPTDFESIAANLLDEYQEVRRSSQGRIRADARYITHVVTVLSRVMWPWLAAIIALRILSFPLPSGWNPSLVPAPGVSLLDAVIFLAAGLYSSHRARRILTGVVTAGATSLVGFTMFLVRAAATTPSLLLAPFEKPFIFVILSVLLMIALGFGVAVGIVGAAMGRRLPPMTT